MAIPFFFDILSCSRISKSAANRGVEVPETLTSVECDGRSPLAFHSLKTLIFRRFGMKKGLPDCSENPYGGVRGIRTLEPLNTTNTLAGCPYRPLRHVSMLHIGATTWHLTIVPRTSATRCAARGVIRGLTAGQRAGFESPVNVTIPATISSATPAISRRPALRQARPRAGGKEIATTAPQPVRQGPLHPGPARYDKGYEYRT